MTGFFFFKIFELFELYGLIFFWVFCFILIPHMHMLLGFLFDLYSLP